MGLSSVEVRIADLSNEGLSFDTARPTGRLLFGIRDWARIAQIEAMGSDGNYCCVATGCCIKGN